MLVDPEQYFRSEGPIPSPVFSEIMSFQDRLSGVQALSKIIPRTNSNRACDYSEIESDFFDIYDNYKNRKIFVGNKGRLDDIAFLDYHGITGTIKLVHDNAPDTYFSYMPHAVRKLFLANMYYVIAQIANHEGNSLYT
jgi:hypothetical protein